ncbi:MAG: transporter [Micrococcaceae bacterium]|nr:transporter [Micrococcaceae bacterium]
MTSSLPPTTAGIDPSTPAASPRGRYAQLPRLSGAGFLPLGFFARLPLAMLTVGVLTLVTAASGSYAIGGFAAGAVGIGSALGAPLLGFVADRRGQRPILLWAAAINALAVAAVVVISSSVTGFDAAAVALVLSAAFLTGATSPQVGPLARVRWIFLTRKLPERERTGTLETALSYEGTADELTFVLGPALVGILASLIAPWLPLALAAVLTAVLVSLFAVHPTERAVQRHGQTPGEGQASRRGEPLHWRRVVVPVLGMVCMGTFFGSTQTTLSAFTGSFGSSELAGLLYAVMGLSSAAGALSVAFWPARFPHALRWVMMAALMVGLACLLLVPNSVPEMVLVLLLLGFPVGPVMVTVFSIGGIVAPRRWLGTVMTALASGIVAGTALGSSVAGSIAQNGGYSAAWLVPIGAAVALLVLGLGAGLLVRRAPGAVTGS